jgi:glycosyltransferase involved in cell wall biosynthesis
VTTARVHVARNESSTAVVPERRETTDAAAAAAGIVPSPDPPYLSIIIPIYNEEGNIGPLMRQVFDAALTLNCSFEVLAVDDGSDDGTFALLDREASERPQLKVIRFRRNYGQTAAMMAGIDHAAGQILISLDADLQNDPADIPKLLSKLSEGYDVVSGWRIDRQDARLRRTLVSRVASRLISRLTGVRLNDYGCTLKAYRRDVIKGVKLYGEMHRFIPVYASWMGARIAEIPVQHHPRVRGASKYGLERVFKVVLDIMVVKFLERHFAKPIYVFGGVGLVAFASSFAALAAAVWLRLARGVPLADTPLPVLVALLFLFGVGGVLMGLLAEMTARTYFESQHQPAYLIRDSRNL